MRFGTIATQKLVVMQNRAAYLVSTHLFSKFSIFLLQSLLLLRQGTWENHHGSKIWNTDKSFNKNTRIFSVSAHSAISLG